MNRFDSESVQAIYYAILNCCRVIYISMLLIYIQVNFIEIFFF